MCDSPPEFAWITGVILLGGLGSRLRPVISDRPKALVEVRGRPFLTYILDQLNQTGMRQVVLATGYMGDKIQEVFGNNYKSLDLMHSREEEPMGTGGALRLALNHCPSEPIFAINGDSYIDADWHGYLRWFYERDRHASLLLARSTDSRRFGRVRVGEDGLILGFEEKGAHPGPGWINAGAYFFKRQIISAIPAGRFFSLERELFPKLVGGSFYGYRCDRDFIDIGTPESYYMAEKFFFEKELS
jgi:D-glycero-alpha-D-manno-heptose 1-phosphate guanylyltransferase